MSIFHVETLSCPACGASVDFEVVDSVNADRRPDLRDAILDGSFQREMCGDCGTPFRLQPNMTYLDIARRQWFLVQPADEYGQWGELESAARAALADAYGPGQPAAVQAIGKTLQARATYGWAAFREKLLAREHGLDDANLELVKIALLRGLDDPPLGDDVGLRLLDVDPTSLTLGWIRESNEVLLESLEVPRSIYDEIAADNDAWSELRQQVTAGPFVDINRLLVAPAPLTRTELETSVDGSSASGDPDTTP